MSAHDTLDAARQMLKSPNARNGSWARSTALLTRQALEEALFDRLRAHGVGGKPSFTTQLIIMREAVHREQAATIAYVWAALSSATHVHGYAMPPTVGELQMWIEAVDEFLNATS